MAAMLGPIASVATSGPRISTSSFASSSSSSSSNRPSAIRWDSGQPIARRGAVLVSAKKHRRRTKNNPDTNGGDAELQPLKTTFSTSLDWPEFNYDLYQLGNIVGQGSYGDVFEGFDTAAQRPVAVKRMTKFRDSNSVEKTLFKLTREVSLLRLMQTSKYTVELYEALEDDYSVYIVTELCLGGDLEGLLQDRGNILSEKEAAQCMRPVLEFLQACHAEQVCYGDVKPSNFMLEKLRESKSDPVCLKAIDFGCSQRVHEGVPLQVRMGTPIYFAPEVFQKWYGVEADCWSAGIMLYMLLAGKFPFWTDEELATLTPQDVMKRVLDDEIEYPTELWKNISPQALELVQGLLNKDKFERLTAEGALESEWIRMHTSAPKQKEVYNNIVTKATDGDGKGGAAEVDELPPSGIQSAK